MGLKLPFIFSNFYQISFLVCILQGLLLKRIFPNKTKMYLIQSSGLNILN